MYGHEFNKAPNKGCAEPSPVLCCPLGRGETVNEPVRPRSTPYKESGSNDSQIINLGTRWMSVVSLMFVMTKRNAHTSAGNRTHIIHQFSDSATAARSSKQLID
jgi:hypothetical protein